MLNIMAASVYLFEGLHQGCAVHHVLGAEVGELGPPQQRVRNTIEIICYGGEGVDHDVPGGTDPGHREGNKHQHRHPYHSPERIG